MDESLAEIIELERANYAAMLPVARVTPGLDVIIRDDIIMTSSKVFPTPDTTHACLLQATPDTVDNLIVQVIDYFQSQGLPTAIYVSPACTPADLPRYLISRGFTEQETKEAWLVLYDLPHFNIPAVLPRVSVRPINKEAGDIFASTFMTAFEMPVDLAPYMAQLLQPSIDLPGTYHYLAFAEEEPIGTCSLLCYDNLGILGSVGVVPEYRKSGAAGNLAIRAITDARNQGADLLMLQTAAGTWLERLLRINGFKKVFVRTCYTYHEQSG